jgi:hypothetical protein
MAFEFQVRGISKQDIQKNTVSCLRNQTKLRN